MHPEELKSDAGSFVVKIKCYCDFILSFLVNSYFIFQCAVTFGNYIDVKYCIPYFYLLKYFMILTINKNKA
jgi:hypothetical protein